MINIVIPMSGNGSRFYNAGFTVYKPFLPVNGMTMIEAVVENTTPESEHQHICILRYQNMPAFQNVFMEHAKTIRGITITEPTQGAAETVLKARNWIDNDSPLIIANSDQLIDAPIQGFIDAVQDCDAGIMTFMVPDDETPKWSYVELDDNHYVTRVAEKEMISNLATVGIYYFKHGKDFVRGAESMMKNDIRTNGEFYVAPVFNELIKEGKAVGTYQIAAASMHGLGTPDDYEAYLELTKEQ